MRAELWGRGGEGFGDGLLGEGLHDGVAGGVGVDGFVGGELGAHAAFGGGEGGVIVEEDEVLGLCVGGEPGVELANLGGGENAGTPGVTVGGEDGGEDDADVGCLGDIDHGAEVVLDGGHWLNAGVHCDVVGSGEDDHGGGEEMDDILLEADEHLRGGLAGDAAVDIRAAGEEGAVIGTATPAVGDGVSEEDDALDARPGGWEGFVVGTVPR